MARSREFNKEAVLDRAMQFFEANGYEGTSMRDLLDAMGISSSSFYEVFGDKRSIFLAVLERSCHLERAQIAEMAVEAATPQLFIEHLFASVDHISAPNARAHGSLAFNTMVEFGVLDEQVTQLLLAHYFGIADLIARVLAEGQKAGAVTTQDSPQELAYTILSTLQGVATVKGVQPNFPYRSAITRMMIKLLNQ